MNLKVKEERMKKKVSIIVTLCVLASVVIAITVGCVWTEVANNPNYYTADEHFERVCELAEEKVGKDNYKIDYLYNEKDELFGFLIEYSADIGGLDIVMVHNPSFSQKVSGVSMYCGINANYMRYKIRKEETEVFENGIKWIRPDKEVLQIEKNGKVEAQLAVEAYPDRLWEINENGSGIMHTVSPYALAGADDEMKYLLQVKQNGKTDYIPAIKKGDKYLNLISLEEFEYQYEYAQEEQAVMGLTVVSHKSTGNY